MTTNEGCSSAASRRFKEFVGKGGLQRDEFSNSARKFYPEPDKLLALTVWRRRRPEGAVGLHFFHDAREVGDELLLPAHHAGQVENLVLLHVRIGDAAG